MSVTPQTLCIILVCKCNLTSSLQQIFYLHSHAVLVAHNGFGFDFPVLLAEVEQRPRQFVSSIFEDHNINFSDTLPLLRKVKIKNLRVQHGIYGLALPIIDEERWRRVSCWDCAWNRKLYKHFVGTDMEGKVTRSSII